MKKRHSAEQFWAKNLDNFTLQKWHSDAISLKSLQGEAEWNYCPAVKPLVKRSSWMVTIFVRLLVF